MKLDIGSESYISEDADIGLDIIAETVGMNVYEGRVDIMADAHHLPFRDEVFDEVFSGQCIGVYTAEQSVRESVRVLKTGCEVEYRTYIYGLPMIVSELLSIANISWIEGGFHSVHIKAIKEPYKEYNTAWLQPGSAKRYLEGHKECIADWELDNPDKKYSERHNK